MTARVLSACAALCILAGASLRAQPYRAVRLGADRWRIEVANDPPRIVTREYDRRWTSVELPGFVPRIVPGAPALPVAELRFAVPPGGRLVVTVGEPRVEEIPLDAIPYGDDPVPAALRAEAASAGAWAAAVPLGARDGVSRRAVELYGARYDAARRVLRWLRSATVDVRIAGIEGPFRTIPATGSFDPNVVNTDDARGWRAAPRPAASPSPARSTAGPQTRLKLTYRETGIYRMTRADLAAAGLDVAAIDPRTFRLFHDDVEQPIVVAGGDDGSFDDGDYVEFVGERMHGENGFPRDLWNDDNASFLEWGGADGLRSPAEDAAPGAAPDATRILAVAHLEQDHLYHDGDSDTYDRNLSDYTFGETWIWKYLLKKDTLVADVTLPPLAAGEPGALFLRVKGSSRDPSRMRVDLNGDSVGSFELGNLQLTTVVVPVADGALHAGANRVVVTNVGIVSCPPEDPTCTIERFYVDWIDVHYAATPRADGDRLAIDQAAARRDTLAPQPGTRSAYRIAGWSADTVVGYDRTTFARLTGARLEHDAEHAVTFALADSGRYVFAGPAGVLRPSPDGLRLELRTTPDFAADAAGADYVVVTHRAFRAAADRIAAYRRDTDGYQPYVADVADLYDAYAAGHTHPHAIHDFVRDLYTRSGGTHPRFVLLLGDASWDPLFRADGSTKIDYVPTYGVPANDTYFVTFDSTGGSVRPALSIGRIPAETLADAQAVIDKIVAYESQPPQPWHNRIVFTVGGKNSFEQQVLLAPVNDQITTYVRPFCLADDVIIKSRLDYVTYDDLDSIISAVNAGTLWFYFTGHGGTRIIDIGVERPDVFDTEGKYPFFATMSCNTAHFAEPFETGLNERFTMAAHNGAIASYGTSGIGEANRDGIMSGGMFKGILVRGFRTWGETTRYGKLQLLDATGEQDFYGRNAAEQYVVLGDPATKIPLVVGPELLVDPAEISTTPDVLTERTAATVTTRIRNAGTCFSDSVVVAFAVKRDTATLYRAERTIPPFDRETTLAWNWDFADATGTVSIVVTVDPGGRITERDKANNTAALVRSVLPRGTTQIFPLDCAEVDATSPVDLVVANPSFVAPDAEDPRIEFAVSRDADFLTTDWQTAVAAQPVYTRAAWPAAATGDSIVFWRARYGHAGAWEDWSSVRSFRLVRGPVSGERWRQRAGLQLAPAVFERLARQPDGTVTLGTRPVLLDVVSAGNNQSEFQSSVIRVDGADYSPDRRGFNVAVVDGITGAVRDTVVFDTYRGAPETTRMTDYLRAVPGDATIAVAVRDDAAGYHDPASPVQTNVTPELAAEMARFGAALVDSIRFRDSYAFVGSRARPGEAREMHAAFGGVFFSDTLAVRATAGRMRSHPVGPARRWLSATWTGSRGDSGRVDLRALGPLGETDTLLVDAHGVAPDDTISLGGIDAARFPYVRLEAAFAGTAASGPALESWAMRFDSDFPELGITSQVVRTDPDSTLEGDPVTVRADVYNAGRSAAARVRIRLSKPAPSGTVAVDSAIDVPAGAGAHTPVSFDVATAGLRGSQRYELRIDPLGETTQYYAANDAFAGRFISGRDAGRPVLTVLFDGHEVADGDVVSPRPLIAVTLRDDGPLPITDTTSMEMYLDNARVPVAGNAEVQAAFGLPGEEKVHVRYQPVLEPGYHSFSVTAKDASGNAADTLPYLVNVRVTTDDGIESVYPFPDPTRGETEFTFILLGTSPPEDAEIKIYTVAGRLIRTIPVAPGDVRIGFNHVRWDGRDAEGAELANGVYFYKLAVTRAGGKKEETVGKLGVLR